MAKGNLFLEIIVLILLVIVGWMGFDSYRNSIDQKSEKTPMAQEDKNVPIQILTPKEITLTNSYIGTVQPIHAVSVLPYITGFIDKVLVKGGQEVKKDDVLFILKQDQYQAQKEAAAAAVAKAKADLENERLYLERIQKTSSKAISQTELDNAKTNYLSAEADLKSAEANLKLADVNYNYTTIRATIDGIVGNITATPGDYVSPQGNSLAYVLQYTPIRVAFTLPEKDFLKIQSGLDFFKKGKMKLLLADQVLFEQNGNIQFSDNKINESASSITLYADFDNPQKTLLPNAYVTVLFEQSVPNALTVDKNWVSMEENGNFVYLLENGVITKKAIELGQSIDNQFYIPTGLNAGDQVITGQISSFEIGKPAKPLIRQKE